MRVMDNDERPTLTAPLSEQSPSPLLISGVSTTTHIIFMSDAWGVGSTKKVRFEIVAAGTITKVVIKAADCARSGIG